MSTYSEIYTRGRKTRNQTRRRKMIEQKLMALVLLILSVAFVCMTSSAGEDCGGGLLIGAFSLYLLLTRRLLI